MSRSQPFRFVAFDADDTLWVNEPFYQNAQRRLAELLRGHVDAHDLGERLYARERHNLSLFGYGAKGFTLSMIETAIELSGGRITGHEIQALIDEGKFLISRPIELYDGVRETVESLAAQRELLLITKGDLFDQESKIARSGLAEHFRAVEIVSEKDEGTYRSLLERHGVDPEDFLMIGNSLRSDILPVVRIGATAVFVPRETTWQHEHAELDAEQREHFFEVRRIADVPALLRELETG